MDYLARHIPVKADPKNLLPSVRSIIAVTLNYHQLVEKADDRPRIAEYALGRDYHKVLKRKLEQLGKWIAQFEPEAEYRVCVDSMPILEREYAHLAGLGWFGKNTCLIDSKRGSRFFIGLLLTSVQFEPDLPSVGGCGSCRLCIEACPTGAIVQVNGRWQVDARSCISYLTIEHDGPIAPELAQEMGDWVFGCDVCQDVCPFNQARLGQPFRAQTTAEADFVNRRSWPSLSEILELPLEEWDRLTAGSPVRRAGYDGLKRNVTIALNNLAKQKSHHPSSDR